MTMSRNERGLSRRAFLGLGATAAMAAGAAGLAGCSPQASSDAASAGASDAGAASGSTAAGGPSFLTEPSPIAESDIKETVEADIVIVGAGLSGISAARAAVESGAKNIVVVEKATTWQYRSNQVGCIGGKIQEDLGIHIDKNAAVGQIMKECGYRPNQRILNLWADNSGEAFDWFLAASEGQYVVEAESDTYDGKSMSVRKMHWPHPAEANIADDFYPIFDDCQICLPDNGPTSRTWWTFAKRPACSSCTPRSPASWCVRTTQDAWKASSSKTRTAITRRSPLARPCFLPRATTPRTPR